MKKDDSLFDFSYVKEFPIKGKGPLKNGYYYNIEDHSVKKFDIKNVDLVIVPGIVFDKNVHRIGYGYGYYDRFLVRLRKGTIKVGLCYDFQLVDKIQDEKHDVAMDILITERRVLKIQC